MGLSMILWELWQSYSQKNTLDREDADEFPRESFQLTLQLSPWLGGWFQIERLRQRKSAKANTRGGIHFSLKVTWKYACSKALELLKECDLFIAEKSCLEADLPTFSLFSTHLFFFFKFLIECPELLWLPWTRMLFCRVGKHFRTYKYDKDMYPPEGLFNRN